MKTLLPEKIFSFLSFCIITFSVFASDSTQNQKVNFKYIQNLALELSKKPYQPNKIEEKSDEAKTFGQRIQLQYKWNKGLWKQDNLEFYIAFMPVSEKFNTQVNFYQITDNKTSKIDFDPNDFNYGNSGVNPDQLPKAFTGFRIVNAKDDKDILVFQGASYFRPIPPESYYGLSARALTVNTVIDEAKEEFPEFTDFWLVKPEKDSPKLTFYALLNGDSVTGAYEFTLNYEKLMTIDVKSTIFLKKNAAEIGFAPLTSQFWYSHNSQINFKQARPEVHNSDGLIMHGDSLYYWMPLVNYIDKEAINSYNKFKSLDYFGLLQRDRDFSHYLDSINNYHLDPNVWIKPEKNLSSGNVRLVILPSNNQHTDNVNTFWIPDKKPEVGKPFDFNYTIFASLVQPHEELGHVKEFWQGKYHEWQNTQLIKGYYFMISFVGDELLKLNKDAKITPNIEVNGPAKIIGTPNLTFNKDLNSWLLSFFINPENKDPLPEPINIQCYLVLNNKAITETWSYLWRPTLSMNIKYQ